MVKKAKKDIIPGQPTKTKNNKTKQTPKVEKEVFIEDLDKKPGNMTIDIDEDGSVGDIETEINKMGVELEKIEDELQAISDEDGLEMVSQLRGLLGTVKAGGIANIKELINQARQLKRDLKIELATAMRTTPEGEERAKKLRRELMKLFEELEKNYKHDLDNDIGKELISGLKKIGIDDIIEDPIKVSDMIKDTRELFQIKEKEHSLIATIGSALKTVFQDKENDKLNIGNKIAEKEKEKDKNIPIEAEISKKQKAKDKEKDSDKAKEKDISTEKNIRKNKELGSEYSPSQNNDLVGIIKELANSGDTKKLKEVFENHKSELQLNDYAKILDKPVKVGMSVEKLQMEVESKAIKNRVTKTMGERNIVIHDAKNPTVDRSKVSSLLIEGPKKESKGMELNFGDKK